MRSPNNGNGRARKLTELALLTAVALILFAVELRLPNLLPIPGVKLGLANVVTVYAVYRYRPREAALILVARVLLGSLFAGSALTLLYSLAGSLLCLAGMLPLRRVMPERLLWLCSVLGAVLHNLGQMAVAVLVTSTPAIAGYLPLLLVAGCIAGAFTGLCAQLLVARNRHHALGSKAQEDNS